MDSRKKSTKYWAKTLRGHFLIRIRPMPNAAEGANEADAEGAAELDTAEIPVEAAEGQRRLQRCQMRPSWKGVRTQSARPQVALMRARPFTRTSKVNRCTSVCSCSLLSR